MDKLRACILLLQPKTMREKVSFQHYILRKLATKAKVNAVLDEIVTEDCNPKRHPGILKMKPVQLPNPIVNAIVSVLKDQPIKALMTDALALRKYLYSRKPPVESMELKARQLEYAQEIESEDKIDVTSLTEEEQEQLMQVRGAKLKNLLAQRMYVWKNIDYDDYMSKKYLVARSAANYAVLMKVFNELKVKDPSFRPKTLLDFGSGVGTVTWATRNTWNTIKEYFCVDKSSHMNDLADLILRGGDINNQLPSAGFFFRQFLPTSQTLKYDLVVSAFSLLDLPTSNNRLQTVMNLWNKTSGYMVLIEDGTMAGSRVINEARDFLLEFGNSSKNVANVALHIVAPCPHDLPCPKVKTKKPCTFPVQFLTLPYGQSEENKATLFSYLVIKKGIRPVDDLQWPRLVQPVLVRSKHTICRACCSNGQLQEIIFTSSKHGKLMYHCARSSKWGDLLPVKVSVNESEE